MPEYHEIEHDIIDEFIKKKGNLRRLASISIPSSTLTKTYPCFDLDSSTDEEYIYHANHRGGIKEILSKAVSDTGAIHYSVRWKDGRKSLVPPTSLIHFAPLLEQYEHERFIKNQGMQKRGISSSPMTTRTKRPARSQSLLDAAPVSSDEDDDDFELYTSSIKKRHHMTTRRNEVGDQDQDEHQEQMDDIDELESSNTDESVVTLPSKRQPARRSKQRLRPYAFSTPNSIIDSGEDSYIPPPAKRVKSRHTSKEGSPISRKQTSCLISATNALTLKRHDQICNGCGTFGKLFSSEGPVDKLNKYLLLPCRYCSRSTHSVCCKEDRNYQIDTTRSSITSNNGINKATGATAAVLEQDTVNAIDVDESTTTTADEPMTTQQPRYHYHVCTKCLKGTKVRSCDLGMCDICSKKYVSATDDNDHLLFRCKKCDRAICDDCIPTDWDHRNGDRQKSNQSTWEDRLCFTCRHFADRKVDLILTCRTVDSTKEPIPTALPSTDIDDLNPINSEIATSKTTSPTPSNTMTILKPGSTEKYVFLVKWANTSYRHLNWVPESWLVGVSTQKIRNFIKKYQWTRAQPVHQIVPLPFKTIERILEVKRAVNGEVIEVFAKFSGLPYDEACWDRPPSEVELKPAYLSALHRFEEMKSIRPSTNIRKRLKQLRLTLKAEDFGRLRELKSQPSYLKAGKLFPHQMEGLNWLQFQWERKQPCILADDMGLGKTIQIITFLNLIFRNYGIFPFMVIVPNSTVTNWIREFNTWAPDMYVVPYVGSKQSRKLARDYEIFRNGRGPYQISCHVVVMSYEAALSDMEYFNKLDIWPCLIVDEAQRLKNNASLLFNKLHDMKTDNRILLTGTPLQNNIGELINIMHFIDPISFADVKTLTETYSDLTHETVARLHEMLKPYFLRRTKELSLPDLPPKKEIIVPLSMTSLQKELYKDSLARGTKLVAQLQKYSKSNVYGSSAPITQNYNNLLMVLRKLLNHPYLLDGVELPKDNPEEVQQAMVDASAKLKLLRPLLKKLLSKSHRVLIFSTMAIALNILEDYLAGENINYVRLDGGTKQVDRVSRIDVFNAPNSDVNVFLLTTRAGGVGINLATADTVIIYDSDFNPHADMQAISRAHRFGQKKPVLILRLITRSTVEERILEKSKKKLVLDHLVVEKMDKEKMNSEDVESIIKFGLKALFEDDGSEDIVYDAAAIDELLDRNTIFAADQEEKQQVTINSDSSTTAISKATDDKSNEDKSLMSFSFAKIWQKHSKPSSTDGDTATELTDGEKKKDEDVWEALLTKNRLELEEEERLVTEQLGRGARRRKVVSYNEAAGKTPKVTNEVVEEADSEDAEYVDMANDDDNDEDEDMNRPDVSRYPAILPRPDMSKQPATMPAFNPQMIHVPYRFPPYPETTLHRRVELTLHRPNLPLQSQSTPASNAPIAPMPYYLQHAPVSNSQQRVEEVNRTNVTQVEVPLFRPNVQQQQQQHQHQHQRPLPMPVSNPLMLRIPYYLPHGPASNSQHRIENTNRTSQAQGGVALHQPVVPQQSSSLPVFNPQMTHMPYYTPRYTGPNSQRPTENMSTTNVCEVEMISRPNPQQQQISVPTSNSPIAHMPYHVQRYRVSDSQPRTGAKDMTDIVEHNTPRQYQPILPQQYKLAPSPNTGLLITHNYPRQEAGSYPQNPTQTMPKEVSDQAPKYS